MHLCVCICAFAFIGLYRYIDSILLIYSEHLRNVHVQFLRMLTAHHDYVVGGLQRHQWLQVYRAKKLSMLRFKSILRLWVIACCSSRDALRVRVKRFDWDSKIKCWTGKEESMLSVVVRAPHAHANGLRRSACNEGQNKAKQALIQKTWGKTPAEVAIESSRTWRTEAGVSLRYLSVSALSSLKLYLRAIIQE